MHYKTLDVRLKSENMRRRVKIIAIKITHRIYFDIMRFLRIRSPNDYLPMHNTYMDNIK